MIELLNRDAKNEVVEVLACAFRDYPVMRFILRSAGSDYEKHLNALVGFFTEARFARDNMVFGIRENGTLIAAALLDQPEQRSWSDIRKELDKLQSVIGEDAYGRFQKYEAASAKAEPSEPHYFLGMIGARPEHHGKGYGRILLDRVQDISSKDARSGGVCLETEKESNVNLYRRFGYQIISERDLENLHSWCLYLRTA